jgi:hypothetical protein
MPHRIAAVTRLFLEGLKLDFAPAKLRHGSSLALIQISQWVILINGGHRREMGVA